MQRKINNSDISKYVLASIAASFGLAIFIGYILANHLHQVSRARELESLEKAIVAGPLAIVRLNSKEIAQSQLERLLQQSIFEKRGVSKVVITGGEKLNYEYANWESTRSVPDSCEASVETDIQFEDAINPYRISIHYNSCLRMEEDYQNIGFALLCMILILIGVYFSFWILFSPIYRSIQLAEEVLTSRDINLLAQIRYRPISELATKVVQSLESEQRLSMVKVATQVAHDIRSPLAAMEILSGSLDTLPEDKRVLLRNSINRIKDIANTLTGKGRIASVETDSKLELHLISPILEEMITEKRIQYRDRLDIEINYVVNEKTYGAFSLIEKAEFKRIISNVIDNSVEASNKVSGSVQVEIKQDFNFYIVEVTDNGKGIDSSILPKLGSQGATFDKSGGSGLGLFHAKSKIESWGGRFSIDSIRGQGTTVEIRLLQQKNADWFLPSISIYSNSNIIFFDDDQSIHQVWQQRFGKFDLSKIDVKLFHISSPKDFRRLFGQLALSDRASQYFMDYEVLGEQDTGLSLIKELGIAEHSALVTSHYDSDSILAECSRIGVKVLPKSMCIHIPIEHRTN